MPGALQQPVQRAQQNPLLQQIIEQAEANVPKEMQEEFLSVMVAGGKLMWSPQFASERQAFDQAIQKHQSVPTVVAHTVLKVISIIQNESGKDTPINAVGIAAPIFMAHALQYVESKHQRPVNEAIIDETVQLIGANLLRMYGVTEDHMKELIRQRTESQSGQTPSGDASMGDEGALEDPSSLEPEEA